MNKIGWIIFSAVVVLILGGLIVWTRMANPPVDLAGVENNSVIAASEQNRQFSKAEANVGNVAVQSN